MDPASASLLDDDLLRDSGLPAGERRSRSRFVEGDTARENVVLRALVAWYRQLSSLASHDVGINAVVEMIAARADTAVAAVSEELIILAAAHGEDTGAAASQSFTTRLADPELRRVVDVVQQTRRALRIPGSGPNKPLVVAPILVGESVSAFLLTLDDEPAVDEDLRLLLSEHAATVCGVILGREQLLLAAASQVRYDLVEGLLGSVSDADEVQRWARHLGFSEDEAHRVVSVVVEICGEAHNLTRAVTAAVERYFRSRARDAITAVRGSEVVVILAEREPLVNAQQLANACVAAIAERFPNGTATAGIGRVCRLASEVAGSYEDARRTVDLSIRRGRAGTATAFEELGVHRVLFESSTPARLREFARDVFDGVLTSSRGNDAAEYLSTLACYFRQNNSLKYAAEQLHLHPNTVHYRIRRVETMSSLDFRNYRDRLMAQIALEIVEGLGGVV